MRVWKSRETLYRTHLKKIVFKMSVYNVLKDHTSVLEVLFYSNSLILTADYLKVL